MKPGRELDALIAEKVMEWQIDPYTGDYLRAVWRDVEYSNDLYNQLKTWWTPSTDIACAWAVVEKLLAGGLYMEFKLKVWSDEVLALTNGTNWLPAATAPHAICLAALKFFDVVLSSSECRTDD